MDAHCFRSPVDSFFLFLLQLSRVNRVMTPDILSNSLSLLLLLLLFFSSSLHFRLSLLSSTLFSPHPHPHPHLPPPPSPQLARGSRGTDENYFGHLHHLDHQESPVIAIVSVFGASDELQ